MNTPEAILIDLDETILTCSGGGFLEMWKTVIGEHIGGFDVDSVGLYTEIRRVADAFWRDPDRHREGRKDMRATRRLLVSRAVRNLAAGSESAALDLADAYHERRLASHVASVHTRSSSASGHYAVRSPVAP